MITFAFKDFEMELQALQRMAVGAQASVHGKFIARETAWVLEQFLESLKQISQGPSGDSRRWEVSTDTPLRTRISHGRHEPGVDDPDPGADPTGGYEGMYAEISCVWEIEPLGTRGPGRRFVVDGIASTVVTFRDGLAAQDAPCLAMWRMEVGDSPSPGCLFHIQIGESGREERPFPHSLPVPRLPTLLMTPQAAVEFTLGELFQDAWPREVAGSRVLAQWAPNQKRRVRSTMEWLVEEAERGSSAWLGWKQAKPDTDNPLEL